MKSLFQPVDLFSLPRKNFLWIVVILIASTGFAQKNDPPKNLNEAQKNKKKLNQEIKNLDAVLNQTKTSRNITMLHVQTLNIKISKREELIQTINYEINLINKQISQTQKDINKKSVELDTLKNRYRKLLRYAQRNSSNQNRLMFVFASKDFNQAYQRVKYMQEINAKRRVQADSILSKQKKLAVYKESLVSQMATKKELLSSEEQEKIVLSNEKSEQVNQLSQLTSKEKELKTELEQKKKALAAIDKKIKDMIAEIALKEQRARELEKESKKNTVVATKPKNKKNEKETTKAATDPDEELSADFSGNKGKLPWPVSNGVITQGFGPYEHPKIPDFILVNSGVNITAPSKGSSARAIFDGEVTMIADMPDGNGKIIFIRHGTYISVYTNLQKLSVKTGDKVKAKQSIGEIGIDEENGTTLNLQIWKGQSKLNPEDWLFKG
jgi:murein hydrolase activator